MAAHTIGALDMSTIDIAGNYKRFPNQKIAINIYSANGGYIMEVATHPGQVNDLYIVPEDQDLGQEIGKIITMKVLKENHE
jgi:hypothetical protein